MMVNRNKTAAKPSNKGKNPTPLADQGPPRAFRLIPFLVILVALSLGFRLYDIVRVLRHDGTASVPAANAEAEKQEAEKIPDAPPQQDLAAKPSDDATTAEDADKGDAPDAAAQITPSETLLKVIEKDPFAPQFSDEELQVLQSLTKRREELEKRERAVAEQEKLLKASEAQVDRKLGEMQALKKQIEELVGVKQAQEQERIKKLVKVYESMKPKDAARIFNELEFSVLLSVVETMSERRLADIMADMEPEKARLISSKLAEQQLMPTGADAIMKPPAATP